MRSNHRTLTILAYLSLVAGLGCIAMYFYRRMQLSYPVDLGEIGAGVAITLVGLCGQATSKCLGNLDDRLSRIESNRQPSH